jgi:hypothetical protein
MLFQNSKVVLEGCRAFSRETLIAIHQFLQRDIRAKGCLRQSPAWGHKLEARRAHQSGNCRFRSHVEKPSP